MSGMTNGDAVVSLKWNLQDLRERLARYEKAIPVIRKQIADAEAVVANLETLPPTNLLTGNARPPESPDFEKCGHPHDLIAPGPRIPLRYGSAATEVCGACGGYRQTRVPNCRWEPGPPDTERGDDE